MLTKRILIIGGDLRFEKIAQSLLSDGHIVRTYTGERALRAEIEECDCVLLGLPCSKDDICVDAPKIENKVLFKDLFALMRNNQLLLAGKMSERVKALADVYAIRWADYFMRKEMSVLNAIPTVEGAVQIAMEELPVTLHGSRSIVTGYGNIGKPLAATLRDLGSHVTVCARKYTDMALAEAARHCAIDYEGLPAAAADADVLFNTVPATVVTRGVLCAMKRCALIIDLASKPGGVEMDAAKDLGANVIWALSLPGKVAPVSAGEIIKKTLYNIFKEIGEI